MSFHYSVLLAILIALGIMLLMVLDEYRRKLRAERMSTLADTVHLFRSNGINPKLYDKACKRFME